MRHCSSILLKRLWWIYVVEPEKKARPENTSEIPHEAARRGDMMTVIFDALALFCTSILWLKAAAGAEAAAEKSAVCIFKTDNNSAPLRPQQKCLVDKTN